MCLLLSSLLFLCFFFFFQAEDGIRDGFQAGGGRNLIEEYMLTRQQGFGAEVKRRIMLGTYALSSGYYDAYYLQAQKVRTLIIEDFKQAFKKVDALLGATSPTAAFELGAKTQDPVAMYLNDIITIPANLGNARTCPAVGRSGR